MKPTALGLTLLLAVAFPLVSGCKKAPPPKLSLKAQTQGEDQLKPALDLLRQGTEVGQYRDALQLIAAHLSRDTVKQVKPFAPEEKQALQKLYGLSDEEMAEADANVFRPQDAYHLQGCCLFRDAARSLELPKAPPELPNAPPLEQARGCFGWIMRRVRLHEEADDGLPPALVLRRGFGGGRDRALAFLALLRQFQIEGCLVAPGPLGPPDDKGVPVPVLAAVLDDKRALLGASHLIMQTFGAQTVTSAGSPLGSLMQILVAAQVTESDAFALPALYLLDPLLEQPVPGPGGKGIATLSEVRAQPDLLKQSSVPPDVAAKLEAYQVAPYEALSPRMRYLQDLLAFQDKVVLFQDAVSVSRKLAVAGGRDIQVAGKTVRALRFFLPRDEGGDGDPGQLRRFQQGQIPWPAIRQQFQVMRVFKVPDEVPEPARDELMRYTYKLFNTFALQPDDMLVRGQYDAMLQRVRRIQTVLEMELAAKPLEESELQKRLDDWRIRVRDAYLSFIHKEAGGQAKVKALWEDDQYLLNVLQVDSEIPLQSFEKRNLSLILFSACREPLGMHVGYLEGSCLHEKAAQLQAHQDLLTAAGKDVSVVKSNAVDAWKRARGQWTSFLGSYRLSPREVPRRLGEIQQRWNLGDLETALSLWEQLHRDLHVSLEAGCRLAEAQRHLQAGAVPALKELLASLEAFQKGDLPKHLTQCQEKARGMPVLARRLEFLARDWAPQGNLHWLQEAARARLSQAAR